MPSSFELPVSLRIRGPVARVFHAWTTPAITQLWLCDRMDGEWKAGASVHWRYGEHRQLIDVLHVEQNHRLKFRWKAWSTQAPTEVDIEFTDLKGETRVRIRESKWALAADNVVIALDHACGWENLLCRLKAHIELGANFDGSSGSFYIAKSVAPTFPPLHLETERLVLRSAVESDAVAIVRYLLKNQMHFAPTSPMLPAGYYTELYWIDRIQKGIEEHKNGSAVRFHLFVKQAEPELIGIANFTQMYRGPFQAGYLGYGIDKDHEGKGLMLEALRAAIQFVFKDLNFHRIMANHLPENLQSARLLKRLDFNVEGLAKNYLFINGQWRDHVLNSLTNSDWTPV